MQADRTRDLLSRIFDRHRAGRDLIEMARQFAMLLRAGETLDETLEVTSVLADPPLRDTLRRVRQDLREGLPLSDAMTRHGVLSDLYVTVIRIGESRGDLATAFERVAKHLERQRELRDKVRSALTYPALLIVITGLSLLIMFVYVLPQFQVMFENAGASLPGFTSGLLWLGSWLQQYGWLCALAALAALAAGRWAVADPQQRYRWHRMLLRLPLLSELIRKLNVARFTGSLAVVLEGGTPLVDALRLSQTALPNQYLRRSLDAVIDTIKQGGQLADGLRTHAMFPLLATRMIQVGERSGDLAAALDYVARVYDGQVDAAVKRLISILEPALIIVIAAVIAVIIYAVVGAIGELNTLPF